MQCLKTFFVVAAGRCYRHLIHKKPWMLLNILQHTVPTTRNYVAQKVNSAEMEMEKPSFKDTEAEGRRV